jgi:hypothetical protein
MEKTFIKQGEVRGSAGLFETPVKITLIHSGDEYFYYIKKEHRHVFNELNSLKLVLKGKNLKRKAFKTSGTWYIKNWQYETVCANGSKTWWNPEHEQLNKVMDKQDIELLLNEKEIITQIQN